MYIVLYIIGINIHLFQAVIKAPTRRGQMLYTGSTVPFPSQPKKKKKNKKNKKHISRPPDLNTHHCGSLKRRAYGNLFIGKFKKNYKSALSYNILL